MKDQTHFLKSFGTANQNNINFIINNTINRYSFYQNKIPKKGFRSLLILVLDTTQ